MPSLNAKSIERFDEEHCAALAERVDPQTSWHVIWTRSNFEKLVRDSLLNKNYDVFLPMIEQWMKRDKGLPTIKTPMFKGYLFVRHAINKQAYLDICSTKGLIKFLGVRWDRLATIPDQEIQAIKQIAESQLPVSPYPYLKIGTEVRIVRGSMQNARGILVRSELDKGIFVVSVNLLQRSLAVKIDCVDVVPV